MDATEKGIAKSLAKLAEESVNSKTTLYTFAMSPATTMEIARSLLVVYALPETPLRIRRSLLIVISDLSRGLPEAAQRWIKFHVRRSDRRRKTAEENRS